MNESDSAGGGQKGPPPGSAPPAVLPDSSRTLLSSATPIIRSSASSDSEPMHQRATTLESGALNNPSYINKATAAGILDNQYHPPNSTSSVVSSPVLSAASHILFGHSGVVVVNESSNSNSATETTSPSESSVCVLGNSNNSNNPGLIVLQQTRFGYERRTDASANLDNLGDRDRIVAIKKRILEHKHLRLKSVKERHSEHVAEIFFLQSGGNMMEYPAWRKKAQTPELVNFMRSYRLDQNHLDDTNKSLPATPLQSSSHGTEIKIPGVGATPVAVSTQLPAAVVQLTQQGHLPGRAQGGRHGMVFGQIPVPSSPQGTATVPLVPGGTPLVPESVAMETGVSRSSSSPAPKLGLLKRSHSPALLPSTPLSTLNTPSLAVGGGSSSALIGGHSYLLSTPSTPLSSTAGLNFRSTNLLNATNGNGVGSGSTPNGGNGGNGNGGVQEQFSIKARQEVYVMQRVTELQREGLWTEKRLPKIQEPTRPKAHWDYLLEEMVWLSADFAQERKWKKACAKKCARMVQKYFQDKAAAAQKAEKAQELQLKRVAAFVAKEIKFFWSNVEKLVEYKQHTKLEEKRKKALDQHLSFIVDQTEKFSQQLTEGMNKGLVDNSAAPSLNSSRISSPKPGARNSDDEFSPGNESSSDDEETIAKEEEADKEGMANVSEEVMALQRESEMDLDDFLNELPKDYLANRDKIVLPSSEDEADDDEEFKADENSTDDEDTIKEQERNEKNEDHKRELEELNAENEMSMDALMAKYKDLPDDERMEVDSDDGSTENEEDDKSTDDEEEEDGDEEDEESEEEKSESDVETTEDDIGLKNLLNDSVDEKNDQLIDDAAAIAESIQPKGNTLSSTNVVTEVPFLLKHSLREYQHIGLDWLVTMHDRKLNGILADEMGLGKTIQTIALLAHLACEKSNWGPHLIIVPSSVMLNWEMEFKKWCPGFKILTYYGSQKERKAKRIGWTKFNTFHICITSYKLVIQDHQSFRRKKWKYLILDEAQNIKNFKSQRWQLLLNFQTEQRLLLTGTPLQNNLMELWSLMHFLMPHVFQSHKEFKEWFSNPMTGMIEGNSEYNESIVKRLHKVLRPFLLRRLKSEVEKQMPKKYEHVVMCRLSKRQRYLYDDFMSRAKTRETLASGNLLSVINVLMQLRKVCNHPNLFEVRPTISPFRMEGIRYQTASMVTNMFQYDPLNDISLQALNLDLLNLELSLTAYVAYRSRKLSTPKRLIEEIDSTPEAPPQCPSGKFRLHIKVRNEKTAPLRPPSLVKIGTSPAMKSDGNKFVPVHQLSIGNTNTKFLISGGNIIQQDPTAGGPPPLVQSQMSTTMSVRRRSDLNKEPTTSGMILQTSNGRHFIIPTTSAGIVTQNGQRLAVNKVQQLIKQPIVKVTPFVTSSTSSQPASSVSTTSQAQPLAQVVAQQLKYYTATQSGSKPAATILDKDIIEKLAESDEFVVPQTEVVRKENRLKHLLALNRFNQNHCDARPIYGEDLRDCLQSLVLEKPKRVHPWVNRGYDTCQNLMLNRVKSEGSLVSALKSFEDRTAGMKPVFDNFVAFVPNVSAPLPMLHVSHPHPSAVNEETRREMVLNNEYSNKLVLLHPIISAMATQFPDPRLIQYDCGKLQTLDQLLRRLKTGGHRVLIFTQMTRMLDVLEAFLNYHGHIYLRLDGSTKIDQRQILMERFNGDKRIFVFILSTRSGGVGVNLTGADTVIFYDSDWNPTMDAQAQDRCHRIGQTRDVHIYRLVSEKTVEENILKKANQKRLLGDLAIEGGNFTTAYFKSSTIQDLFQVDQSASGDANSRLQGIVELDKERKERLNEAIAGSSNQQSQTAGEGRDVGGVFESALLAAEDEQDVEAAQTAKAEVAADLAEFDENIPIEDEAVIKPEKSKAEQEVDNLMKQLSPIERYAMKFVEETGGQWTAEQLKAAEAEIEQQKREWEANRQAALLKEEEEQRAMDEEDISLTYSSEDAKNQIWISENTGELMPMWCPPTPPQDDNDVYTDYTLSFLYETEIMSESQLPPVYVKKEFKRSRIDAGLYLDSNKRPMKMRKEDTYYPPRSLFDRPSPALAKMRRDLKLQRYRGNFKATVHLSAMNPNLIPGKPHMHQKPLLEPDGMADWFIYEDMAMLHIIQNLQGFPLNLMILSPGHTPNWDLVADIVNQSSRTYRSPKQCRYRYEAIILPREEGRPVDIQKKQKKNKPPKNPMKNSRSLRTSQLFANDNNSAFTKLMRLKIDSMKVSFGKKQQHVKQRYSNSNSTMKNPKHAEVLLEHGIANYDAPPNPIDIAQRRVDRIAKEKQKMGNPMVADLAQTSQTHQKQQIQEISVPIIQQQPQQPQTVVIQQQPQVVQSNQGNIALVQTPSPMQTIRHSGGITLAQQASQQQQQIVKAIVSASSTQNILAGQVQQITVQGQQQQASQSVVVPSSVSVVLTTPVSSITTGQHHQSQIVSIQQSPLSNAISTAQATGSVVHTLSTTSAVPQKMTVTQLAQQFTSPGMQQNVVSASALRAQRIVPGGLQEVVLHQRSGTQSPTVVSVSNLAQGVTQAQLQAAQLRLQMGQPVSGVVTKGISVTGTKTGNTQQLFYRQQPIRQQLKVLHTTPGQGQQTMVPGQTAAIVSPAGTIFQGGIVQTGSLGQKVAVVTAANSAGVMTNVHTVQVASPNRTNIMKQIAGKPTITRQVTDGDVQALMMKRQLINQQQQQQAQSPQQHKTQIVSQTQIFTPTNVQVQPGTSATIPQSSVAQAQQIATLVKTSAGPSTGGMTFSQVKPGQIKQTMTATQAQWQLQKQQQIALQAQQRKSGKMTQITQLANKTGVPTQLIVNSKNLPGTVTVQQIQQVIRQAQPGTLTTAGLVLGKTSVGRVIPVSVASQPNTRQIQVVTATSSAAQALSGNFRATHVTSSNLGTLQGAIKVANVSNAQTQQQQQQALLTALQNQNVRSGSLVAVAVQQNPTIVTTNQQQQQVAGQSNIVEIVGGGQQQQAGGASGGGQQQSSSSGPSSQHSSQS